MFHFRSSEWLRRVFSREGNVVTLSPTQTLRVHNLQVTGTTTGVETVPSGEWGTIILAIAEFPYAVNSNGNYILKPPSGMGMVEVVLPAPPTMGGGRWTFVRGITTRDIRIVTKTGEGGVVAGLLKGSLLHVDEDSTLGDYGDPITALVFSGGDGRPGDSITIISDGTDYYFDGRAARNGFGLQTLAP